MPMNMIKGREWKKLSHNTHASFDVAKRSYMKPKLLVNIGRPGAILACQQHNRQKLYSLSVETF